MEFPIGFSPPSSFIFPIPIHIWQNNTQIKFNCTDSYANIWDSPNRFHMHVIVGVQPFLTILYDFVSIIILILFVENWRSICAGRLADSSTDGVRSLIGYCNWNINAIIFTIIWSKHAGGISILFVGETPPLCSAILTRFNASARIHVSRMAAGSLKCHYCRNSTRIDIFSKGKRKKWVIVQIYYFNNITRNTRPRRHVNRLQRIIHMRIDSFSAL